MAQRVKTSGRRGLVLVLVAGFVTAGALAAMRSGEKGIPLSSIPEGVSARRIDGTPVFLEREGKSVTVYATDVHHLEGETALWWCPTEGVFFSPTQGELFDRRGRVQGGPASRGLDQYETRTVSDRLLVDLEDVLPGWPRDEEVNLVKTDFPGCKDPLKP